MRANQLSSMLYLAEDRGYLPTALAARLRDDYKSLSKSIAAFAGTLRRAE